MDILIRICVVGSAIAWLLMWVGDRFGDRLSELEVVKYVDKKVGRGLMVLWVLFLASPLFLLLGYWVIDIVAWVQEALIELSEASKSEKLTLGVIVLVVLLLYLLGYVEYQVESRHRVGRWILTLRILRKVGMVLMVFMVVSTLVGWAIGAVLLPIMLFSSWQDMVWYQKAGLVVCAAWLCLVVKETFWPRR